MEFLRLFHLPFIYFYFPLFLYAFGCGLRAYKFMGRGLVLHMHYLLVQPNLDYQGAKLVDPYTCK